MKINCIHCGHRFELDDSYSDYEGLVRCPTCAGLLMLRIEDGMVKSAMPGTFAAAAPAPASVPVPAAAPAAAQGTSLDSGPAPASDEAAQHAA